jgi:hypothetical protein
MTDEKKKPEEDEVTEEQLEHVAGGLTVSATGQDAQSQSTPPTDVCKTPPPPSSFVPSPYPNVGKPEDPEK